MNEPPHVLALTRTPWHMWHGIGGRDGPDGQPRNMTCSMECEHADASLSYLSSVHIAHDARRKAAASTCGAESETGSRNPPSPRYHTYACRHPPIHLRLPHAVRLSQPRQRLFRFSSPLLFGRTHSTSTVCLLVHHPARWPGRLPTGPALTWPPPVFTPPSISSTSPYMTYKTMRQSIITPQLHRLGQS